MPKPRQSTGTFARPYVKADGEQTVKWSITVPVRFAERFKRLTANSLPLHMSGSQWAVLALDHMLDGLEDGRKQLIDPEQRARELVAEQDELTNTIAIAKLKLAGIEKELSSCLWKMPRSKAKKAAKR